MVRDFAYWFRWIILIPAAIISSVVTNFILAFILHRLLAFIEPYPELPEQLLTPLVAMVTFIYMGAKIAPEYKLQAAMFLSCLAFFMLGYASYTIYTDQSIGNIKLYHEYGGVKSAMSFLGLILGFLFTRDEINKTDITQ